jgi:hypothetical protein
MGQIKSKIGDEIILKNDKKISKRRAEQLYRERIKQYDYFKHGSRNEYMLRILSEYDLEIEQIVLNQKKF